MIEGRTHERLGNATIDNAKDLKEISKLAKYYLRPLRYWIGSLNAGNSEQCRRRIISYVWSQSCHTKV